MNIQKNKDKGKNFKNRADGSIIGTDNGMKIKKIKTTILTFKIIKAKPFWKRSNRAETPRFSKKI
ncbi:hypothetical protein LEP1GSC126_0108 [Leptospira kirschneri str. 200801774]|nr:hypothetical protein LEP1GSC126_0108 [Leptospira kirschneri str. 200801774]